MSLMIYLHVVTLISTWILYSSNTTYHHMSSSDYTSFVVSGKVGIPLTDFTTQVD